MIEVSNLTKKYGDHLAVSDLSFKIEKGGIYGLLGPNGAGKSTTMNVMTGCLAATEGEVKIGGYDVFEDAFKAKRLIGYLPEQPPLYLDRTPREYLTFVARAKKIPEKEITKAIAHVMMTTGITEVGERLIKHLSKGYKQRVGIAQAILGDPDVIILDEPTVGLDPRQIIEIRELIKKLGQKHTVILSSHILSEVQATCQTVMIISHGRLVACDTPQNLEKVFTGAAEIEIVAEAGEKEILSLLDGIKQITAFRIEKEEGGKCRLHVQTERDEDEELCRRLFFAFAEAKKPILRLETARASLEDVFIELTGDAGEKEDEREASEDESDIQA